ncbi:hypothetical protein C0J52_16090 [Blattella germanica]|nr:hypothetical protein C0J52_16090 [Blattella germanica]
MSYPVGMVTLPLIALYIESWRLLQLVLSIPTVILILQIWILPESPRWLISQGRRKEALNIVEKISKKSRFVKMSVAGFEMDTEKTVVKV